MKFFGEPPPRINTALRPAFFASQTMAALWLTSRSGSIPSLEPSSCRAARFMPIELSRGDVPAAEAVELGRTHRFLERLAAAERAIKAIGAQQVFVIEDDVVDANHL